MSKDRLYVDIHVIQTVPPSCVNRDDTGSPKTAQYGGVTRARVSSQAWKHAMRKYFADAFSAENVGVRTKKSVELIQKEILTLQPDMAEDEAYKKAEKVLTDANAPQKDALMFISIAEAKALARLVAEGVVSTGKGKKGNPYAEAFKSAPAYDMSLFGRMIADDASLNIEAASQVAHAISTHAVHNEYDYFTAVDDLQEDNSVGAAHLGTMEFNSSTLYRYASVNVRELQETQKGSEAEIVRSFVEAFVNSMPTGKINSYANHTFPALVYVAIRKDYPMNLVNAFECPVKNTGNGYAKNSVKTLNEFAQDMYRNYGMPCLSFAVGDGMDCTIKSSFYELLKNVSDFIANEG